ncbi:MAG: M1 family metallopeptidase [Anaerolineae bacterium]
MRVRYTNAEDTSLDQIVFRLLPNTPGYGTPEGAPAALDVSSLTVDGTPVQAERRLYNSALYLPLSTPLAPGNAVEIDMAFTGTLPADPAAGYAQYGYIDGVLAIPDFYPLIPVYDDEGWNVELAPTYGDATFTDTALYLVRVTLPGDVTLAASGVAIDRQQNDDGTVSTTFASGPMRDFMIAASRDYQTAQTQVDDVLVTSYYLGSTAGGERALDYASSSLRIYEDLIGAYPFNELDVVATPTRAGGIEYPGLIVVAANLYEQSGGFFEMATVHEVGHQWWYSLVGNDQLDEPWLDESFTQYTAMLYYERRYGADAAANVLENYFRAPYEHLPPQEQQIPIGLPVADYTADLYGVIVYDKGPLFFDQIRTQVGKEAFGRFMQSYLQKYRYGIVYPQDLVDSVESTSGQQIDALYQQWVVGS